MTETEIQNDKADPEAFISTREMAEAIGCCQQTLVRMARAGRVPAIKVGREFRFQVRAVTAALSI